MSPATSLPPRRQLWDAIHKHFEIVVYGRQHDGNVLKCFGYLNQWLVLSKIWGWLERTVRALGAALSYPGHLHGFVLG